MRKLNLLNVLLLSFLFIGCEREVFKPTPCNITIASNTCCTYTLEKNEVPMYSFFKIKVEPKPGYYIHGFSKHDQWGRAAEFYKSETEEDTYFILATPKIMPIEIETRECEKYYINKASKAANFKISASPEKTFAGDTVTLTIIPDACFYLDPDTVEVRKVTGYYNDNEFEKISYTQSQTNPNEFSFIMPDKNVIIYAEAKFAITVAPRKTNFKQGEAIIFDITNHNPDDAFDIQISDGYTSTTKYDYKAIETGIKLSQTYKLPYQFIQQKYPETETGSYILHIYPKNSNYYTETEATATFVIDLADMPDGWTTIGIKNRTTVFWKDGYVEFNLSNIDIPNLTNLKFKYSLGSDSSSATFEGVNSTLFYSYENHCCIGGSDIDKSIDVTPFNKIEIWIEDDDLKYISKKVSLKFK